MSALRSDQTPSVSFSALHPPLLQVSAGGFDSWITIPSILLYILYIYRQQERQSCLVSLSFQDCTTRPRLRRLRRLPRFGISGISALIFPSFVSTICATTNSPPGASCQLSFLLVEGRMTVCWLLFASSRAHTLVLLLRAPLRLTREGSAFLQPLGSAAAAATTTIQKYSQSCGTPRCAGTRITFLPGKEKKKKENLCTNNTGGERERANERFFLVNSL